MRYDFFSTSLFEKEFKKLFKKYPSLKQDISLIRSDIEQNDNIGVDLGSGFRKIRLSVKSKSKGKSCGARVIIHEAIISLENKNVTFVSIYDKSEYANIDLNILKNLFSNL